jgi:hypothetical protein
MNKPRTTKPTKRASNERLYNILTITLLVMTAASCVVFGMLFTNPGMALNPFPPPPTLPPQPTATNTLIQSPPTWTPAPTLEPTASNTPKPTITVPPSNTPFSLVTPSTPTITVTVTKTVKPTGAPYTAVVQAYESTTFRADTGCGDFIVAGQVLDSENKPVTGLIVRLGGNVPGKTFSPALTTLSGIAPAYGQSGFEFVLGIQPVASTKSLYIQLFNQSDVALSDQVYLATYADCKKNLILVRFTGK